MLNLMIELSVDSIRANPFAPHPLLVLKEQAGPRYLVLGIGPLEAEVIAIRLQGIEPPRPLIHDLLSALLERFGARLQRVEISELAGQAFHARLVLEHNDEEFAFDARPSDAIALALREQAPIYAAEAVLDAAGQLPEEEVAETVAPVSASKLDVFKQFIDTLDTDDVRPGEAPANG
jgi:bifunctional DNase/RNase